MKNQEQKKMTMKGFTLIEMIIAMAILVVMSTAIAGTFASGFSTYGTSRELQRNLETAQYAMNTLEKYLRTSTIISDPGTNVKSMTFYDYSSQRCFRYRIIAAGADSNLFAQWFSTSTPFGANPCVTASGSFSASAQVTTGYVTGGFSLVPSDKKTSPKKMGRVTINLSVKKDSSPSSPEARIQATASLRDYSYVGF